MQDRTTQARPGGAGFATRPQPRCCAVGRQRGRGAAVTDRIPGRVLL